MMKDKTVFVSISAVMTSVCSLHVHQFGGNDLVTPWRPVTCLTPADWPTKACLRQLENVGLPHAGITKLAVYWPLAAVC